jgi:hypothetical protein
MSQKKTNNLLAYFCKYLKIQSQEMVIKIQHYKTRLTYTTIIINFLVVQKGFQGAYKQMKDYQT